MSAGAVAPAGAPRDVSISLTGFDEEPEPAASAPRDVRLCLLGFGSVARSLCELLAAQERSLRAARTARADHRRGHAAR